MILGLALVAQLSATATPPVYTSAALERLVQRAASENHAPPPAFAGYRARLESELSLILRDTLGRENSAQIEQLASAAHWVRGGDYEVHVVGYRSQGIGVPYSALSFVKGWTAPSLYGERLRLGVQTVGQNDTTRGARGRDSIVAVHPFASDRERFYRFSGGDTVAVLQTGKRVITVVRIHVTPALRDSSRFAAFSGDIQLDAERGQIVKMRGNFVVRGAAPRGRPLLSRMPGVVGVAYCDFVNVEVNGKYWLPAFQRTEFQSSIALLGRSRALMRIVSDFSEYEVDETGAGADDSHVAALVTTWAPSDSISRFSDWRDALGTATASVSGGDFDDIAPDVWRTSGAPHFDLFPTKADNLVGFDRVGGLYTGLEGRLRMRDAYPGLTVGARAGWAWAERTARGGMSASLERGATTYGFVAERTLSSTNDFLRPLDDDNGGVGAFIASVDSFDYVDRRRALASFSQVLGSFDRALLLARFGAGQDNDEVARLTHGLWSSPVFKPNRHSATGSYALATADLEIHPNVSGDFVHPGVGAQLHYEVGSGTLSWQRAELSVSMREYAGPVTLALHGNGGVVLGANVPPQQLFELGGDRTLPGYAFKEFAGDRAALFRGSASYTLPLLRAPIHFVHGILLPGLAPGFAVSTSGGWTRISSGAAERSVLALGLPSGETGGVRATVGGGVSLFGGSIHLGVARPVDRAAAWRLVFGPGSDF